ncbi:BgTH12-04600 [Blumeria graminis f. sp. triticale]|uniref:Bgt-4109 n=3 Tax=Blumeria graminis TaxID=34373 RepID=A0A9X9L7L4_BLUGR|nr:hypothetical protein BGT96224_4109 [Blumeria graminis f. sp. tritici 96224]CAD6498945.1 BgTH12-04600 [Blumeria graminis f. sp. triticale]VCU39065.1 Bgt-4109 [Blumeria graminis f. sp. tritici]
MASICKEGLIYSSKSRSRPPNEALIDPVYGQRSALPGLDDVYVADDCVDSTNGIGIEALAYLRAVRQEAIGIPNILVAPNSPSKADSDYKFNIKVGNSTSKYEDGAYLSLCEDIHELDQDIDNQEVDSQSGYFQSILMRYKALRTRLQQEPPDDLVSQLDPNKRTQLGPLNRNLSKWWIDHMKNTDPNPIQIACMNKITVLRLLGLLSQGTVLKSGLKVGVSVSRWSWSLLARLPEKGNLTSEEIAVIRELAKKAISIGISLEEIKSNDTSLQESQDEFNDVFYADQACESIDDSLNTQQTKDNELKPGSGIFSLPEVLHSEKIESTPLDESLKDSIQVPEDCEELHDISLSFNMSIEGLQKSLTEKELSGQSSKSNISKLESEDLLAAKSRIIQRLHEDGYQETVNLEPEITSQYPFQGHSYSLSTYNFPATVDMILTIVGEAYGQRDLLERRVNWGYHL